MPKPAPRLSFVIYPYMKNDTEGLGKGYRASAFQFWQAFRHVLGNAGATFYQSFSGRPEHPRTHFHYCPPHVYRTEKGRRNILFTMWEGPKLPDNMAAKIDGRLQPAPDLVYVPSEHSKRALEASGIRVDGVIPLGVNPVFLAANTHRPILATPDRRLTFLWAGSTATRKGWPDLAPAWNASLVNEMGAVLYVKTIDAHTYDRAPGAVGVRTLPDGSKYDNREVDDAGMCRLYEQADVFVGTSLAEGFGLQPLEAMACGALYVGPETPGTEDFITEDTALVVPRDVILQADYGGEMFGLCKASPEGLAQGLSKAYRFWGSPWLEAKRAAGIERARSFLWTSAASRVYDSARG